MYARLGALHITVYDGIKVSVFIHTIVSLYKETPFLKVPFASMVGTPSMHIQSLTYQLSLTLIHSIDPFH